MRAKSKVVIGIKLNYGNQEEYRRLGIEMCCRKCRYFDGELLYPLNGSEARMCGLQQKACRPEDVCIAPERAPGADDEG